MSSGPGEQTCLAVAWDTRVERGLKHLPPWMRSGVDWLRAPGRRAIRIVAGVGLMAGGAFAILPVLGLWMLPLGLTLIGEDVPQVKVMLERSARRLEQTWSKMRG